MKNYHSFILLIAVLSAACSCEKEETVEYAAGGDGGYKIELEGKLEGPATRITESEDPADGLKTRWSRGETINVLFFDNGEPVVASLGSASGDGKFSGEVETGSAAMAFMSEELGCVNVSSKITTSLVGSDMVCTVDLSGQKGTVEDVAERELMYVRGHARECLRFEHQTSVLKLILTGLPGYSVVSAGLSFVPDKDYNQVPLFASSVVYTVGRSGITSEPDDATFYDMTDLDIPVVDGTAVMYLVVPSRGKLFGELSVLVTCEDDYDTWTFRRYVKLNGKSFKASNVVARREAVTDADRVPRIGDYVYSDGSWGELEYYDDKWPQAVIFSNYTSKTDRLAGYTHGYAMALRDAAWPTPWATEAEVALHPDYPESGNVFESVSSSAPMQMMENLDGLTTCKILNERYLSGYALGNYYGMPGFELTDGSAAIPCAMRYGKADWVSTFSSTPNIVEFEAPETTSGWFLPSVGQWYLCLSSLAGINPDDLVMMSSGGMVTQMAWIFPSSSDRQSHLDAFCRYFSSSSDSNRILHEYEESGRMVATTFYLPFGGQMDWYLWACDEATSGTAVVVYLDSTDIVFKYVPKETGHESTNGYAARPVLAF